MLYMPSLRDSGHFWSKYSHLPMVETLQNQWENDWQSHVLTFINYWIVLIICASQMCGSFGNDLKFFIYIVIHRHV